MFLFVCARERERESARAHVGLDHIHRCFSVLCVRACVPTCTQQPEPSISAPNNTQTHTPFRHDGCGEGRANARTHTRTHEHLFGGKARAEHGAHAHGGRGHMALVDKGVQGEEVTPVGWCLGCVGEPETRRHVHGVRDRGLVDKATWMGVESATSALVPRQGAGPSSSVRQARVHAHTHIQTERQTYTHTDRETYIHTHTHTYTHTRRSSTWSRVSS